MEIIMPDKKTVITPALTREQKAKFVHGFEGVVFKAVQGPSGYKCIFTQVDFEKWSFICLPSGNRLLGLFGLEEVFTLLETRSSYDSAAYLYHYTPLGRLDTIKLKEL